MIFSVKYKSKTNKTPETGVPFVTQVENIRQWPRNGGQRASPLNVQSKVQPESTLICILIFLTARITMHHHLRKDSRSTHGPYL